MVRATDQSSTGEWFEVRATVKVKAADEGDAISRVAASIRTSDVPGLYPVGTFDARPTDNPLTETRRHVAVDESAQSRSDNAS